MKATRHRRSIRRARRPGAGAYVQQIGGAILRDRCANLRSMICALAITQVRQLRSHLGPLRFGVPDDMQPSANLQNVRA